MENFEEKNWKRFQIENERDSTIDEGSLGEENEHSLEKYKSFGHSH